jgi:hypothetical protein
MSELTVTEAAIIDLQRQREAFDNMAKRAKNFDPVAAGEHARQVKDIGLDAETIAAMTSPVRLTITFDDPIKTRAQLDALAGAIEEAKALTYEHSLGIMRQRLRTRGVLKDASDALTYLQGRAPSGKRKPGSK